MVKELYTVSLLRWKTLMWINNTILLRNENIMIVRHKIWIQLKNHDIKTLFMVKETCYYKGSAL